MWALARMQSLRLRISISSKSLTVLPIRFYLASTDLTPTYPNVNNRFQCRYFLNLVLIDEEERRYFKQQEIELWRKKV